MLEIHHRGDAFRGEVDVGRGHIRIGFRRAHRQNGCCISRRGISAGAIREDLSSLRRAIWVALVLTHENAVCIHVNSKPEVVQAVGEAAHETLNVDPLISVVSEDVSLTTVGALRVVNFSEVGTDNGIISMDAHPRAELVVFAKVTCSQLAHGGSRSAQIKNVSPSRFVVLCTYDGQIIAQVHRQTEVSISSIGCREQNVLLGPARAIVCEGVSRPDIACRWRVITCSTDQKPVSVDAQSTPEAGSISRIAGHERVCNAVNAALVFLEHHHSTVVGSSCGRIEARDPNKYVVVLDRHSPSKVVVDVVGLEHREEVPLGAIMVIQIHRPFKVGQ